MENSRKSKFFLVLAVVVAIVIIISVAVVVSWYFAVITMFSLFKFAYDLDDLSTPSLSYISEKIGMEFKNCNNGFEFVGGQYKLADYILQYAKDSNERFSEET